MEKWLRTESVSPNVFNFRPCKTLRHLDPTHSPEKLIKDNPRIGLLIDLSGGDVAYRPADLSPCVYTKVATVSKTPPTPSQVAEFIGVVDKFWRENPGKEIAVVSSHPTCLNSTATMASTGRGSLLLPGW